MKKLLCLLIFNLVMYPFLFSQEVNITGKVLDENHLGLPGVNVVIKGTSTGTITNTDGNYSIKVPNANSVLVFSYVGYLTKEITVGDQTEINVTLLLDVAKLNEVVVIGYGTTLKKNVTTAIADVNPDDVPKAANSNINDLLFGRAAGVQAVQRSAQPGGEIDLRIRGRQQNPLIVIDGVVMPKTGLEPGVNFAETNGVTRSNLGGLNPDDIKSIEVLKDASAAIYGIGASDGVILITTKKGSAKKTQVNYSGNISYVQNMPYIKPLTATEYMKYYNQFEGDKYNYDNNMAPFGPTPSDYTPAFTQAQINAAGKGTDWVGKVLKSGKIINQNLNFSGGSDKVTYYFSANYFDQDGTVKNSGLTKYNTRLSMSFNMNKYITFGASLNAGKNKYLNNGDAWQTGNAGANAFRALQAAFTYPAYLPVKDSAGKYTIWQTTGNPVALLNIEDKTDYNSLLSDFHLDINIIPKMLKATIRYGNNNEQATREFYIPSDVYWFDETRARASINNSKRQYQTFESILTFDKDISSLHINAVAGYGEYIDQTKTSGIQAQDMLDAINITNVAAGTAVPKVSSSLVKTHKRSYFGRASFNLLDRYIVTGAIRYDGFSYFFPASKYAAFPSISLGWKLNNESFLKDVKAIDLLKLRASYGYTGRATNGDIAYGGYVPDDVTIPFNDAAVRYTAYYINRFDNPDLTWEKTVMKNIGLDLALFNNRLSGAFDLFRDDITNLLDANARTPALSFLVSAPQNGGHQVRAGWDLNLTYDVLRGKNLFWQTFVNLSHYTFRWEERFKQDVLYPYEKVKDPVNGIYAYETNGILQIGQTVPAWQPANAQMPGAPIFVDRNGDGVLDSADVRLYSPYPKISFGWGNTFKYKHFDLTLQVYGQIGAYRNDPTLGWADPNNAILAGISGSEGLKNVWSTSNTSGTFPGSPYNEALLSELVPSDIYIKKSDFLRARNITLGYTYNFKKNIKSARLYVDVQNAFVITKYKGGDPEVDARTVKGAPAPYPMARTYSVGLNINF